jgi:hypothetical protein
VLQTFTVLLSIDSGDDCTNSTATGKGDTGYSAECAQTAAALMPPDTCPAGQEAMTSDEHVDNRWGNIFEVLCCTGCRGGKYSFFEIKVASSIGCSVLWWERESFS